MYAMRDWQTRLSNDWKQSNLPETEEMEAGMAKIKIHELAKEVDKQSKDILSFLQEKGIEAKAAQSSVEEDVAAMVRKAFGKTGAQTAEGVKEEAPKAQEAKTVQSEEKAENAEDAPKKKKKIIFVSNPQNSKMSRTETERTE